MTTIAFHRGQVAADTGLTARGSRLGHVCKLKRNLVGDVAGASGCATWAAAFRKWFATGEQGPPPEIKRDPQNNDEAKGVVFRADGTIEVYESPGMHTLEAPFYAIGSGAAEARGAMHVGANAELAVRAAMALDESTYGDVTVLDVG
jgi:hypothetical protein